MALEMTPAQRDALVRRLEDFASVLETRASNLDRIMPPSPQMQVLRADNGARNGRGWVELQAIIAHDRAIGERLAIQFDNGDHPAADAHRALQAAASDLLSARNAFRAAAQQARREAQQLRSAQLHR